MKSIVLVSVQAVALSALAASFVAVPLRAQQLALSQESYLQPPDPVRSVITSDAMTGQVTLGNLDPTEKRFLIGISGGMATLEKFGRPYLNLGETPLDHIANRSRRMSLGNTVGYHLIDAATGVPTEIDVPEGATVSGAAWSPNGKHVAFIVHEDEASTLWVADTETGGADQVLDDALNLTMSTSVQWIGDSKHVAVTMVPGGRGDAPDPGPYASTPQVWVTHPGEAPNRTYRFLLKTPHDKAMLEYLITSQLALVNVETGDVVPVGQPAMITGFDAAPGGKFFRVSTMLKPFSYFVPASRFGRKEELWDVKGTVLTTLSERKMTPLGDAPKADKDDEEKDKEEPKRNLQWWPDGNGLGFLQREPAPEKPKKDDDADGKDAGDKDGDKKADPKKPGAKKADAKKADAKKADAKKAPAKKAAAKKDDQDPKADSDSSDGAKKEKPKPRMDRLMHWKAPFEDGAAEVAWQSEKTIGSLRFSDDGKMIFVTQSEKGTRRLFAVALAKPKDEILIHETKPKKGEEEESAPPRRGRGGGGGGGVSLVTRTGSMGLSVVRQSKDGKAVYLRGTEQPEEDKKATESPRSWIDRVELGSTDAERLWQARGDTVRESLLSIAGDDADAVYFTRESRMQPPNTYRWVRDGGAESRMTDNVDPAPAVTAAKHERFQVTRVDGFKFWVKVTIPQNYGKQLPALFWFYPREYSSQKQYDDRTRAPDPNRFVMMRTRSMPLLTLHGYVVVEPDCPIVGEEGRMNDNYVGDLRNSLWAVIDELDRREIIDRNRLAIGGHSYGAFGTANAMVHTPFFKAGIAGDGNYNRTLTPMSFQSERRDIWEAREVYLRMSPLLWAEQLNGALLMYHGMDDNNTGTFPIHAPRMFQALDGLGKPASLYMYPYEGHGPGAKETILDLWARWIHWLDRYVKNPDAEVAPAANTDDISTSERR